MNTARSYNTGFGIQSNTTANGGGYPSASNTVKTENYDGTTWTNKPDSSNTRWATDSGFGTSGSQGGVSGALSNSLANVSATEEYNSSINTITSAAWASGGNANTARRQLGYTGAGTQNAFQVFGGFSPGGFLNNSESYNGTSWTATPNLNSTRGQLSGFGTTAAAVACGGNPTADTTTEEWNGSSWTSVTGMSSGRYEHGGAGTLTAGLAIMGDFGPPNPVGSACEEYDGTTWTSGGTSNTGRRELGGTGSQTAALVGGGNPAPGVAGNTESYDGTSWSEVNNLVNERGSNHTMGGLNGQSSSITTGGSSPSATSTTEIWNGTNWVTSASMAGNRFAHSAGGTSASGLVGLGDQPTPTMLVSTEEFTGETSAATASTLTTS